jgi:hypothetical protein
MYYDFPKSHLSIPTKRTTQYGRDYRHSTILTEEPTLDQRDYDSKFMGGGGVPFRSTYQAEFL